MESSSWEKKVGVSLLLLSVLALIAYPRAIDVKNRLECRETKARDTKLLVLSGDPDRIIQFCRPSLWEQFDPEKVAFFYDRERDLTSFVYETSRTTYAVLVPGYGRPATSDDSTRIIYRFDSDLDGQVDTQLVVDEAFRSTTKVEVDTEGFVNLDKAPQTKAGISLSLAGFDQL
jgi:hypothetical protein